MPVIAFYPPYLSTLGKTTSKNLLNSGPNSVVYKEFANKQAEKKKYGAAVFVMS